MKVRRGLKNRFFTRFSASWSPEGKKKKEGGKREISLFGAREEKGGTKRGGNDQYLAFHGIASEGLSVGFPSLFDEEQKNRHARPHRRPSKRRDENGARTTINHPERTSRPSLFTLRAAWPTGSSQRFGKKKKKKKGRASISDAVPSLLSPAAEKRGGASLPYSALGKGEKLLPGHFKIKCLLVLSRVAVP